MATDINSGMLGRTFKTATMGGGFGTFGSNAKTTRDFVMQSPDLLKQIGGEKALDAYIKENQQYAYGGFGGEGGAMPLSEDTQRIDRLLSEYQMDSVGYSGLDDGRAKVISKDGQRLYAGDPYSYKPAKDNLDTVLKGVAVIGATAGLSTLMNSAGSLFGTSGSATTGTAGTTAGTAGTTGAAGSAGGGMLQGIPAMAGDFGAVGASTTAFDTVVSLTGSEVLAGAASKAAGAASKAAGAVASGADWLSSTWSALAGGGASGAVAGQVGELFKGSSVLRDLLPIIGAGVAQQTKERERADERAWLATEKEKDRQFQLQREADARRRQMPVTGSGMLGEFRVLPGAGNGG